MADILKLQVKYPIQVFNAAAITQTYTNSGSIYLTVTGCTTNARYKFVVTGTGVVGGIMACAVYKNGSHQYNRTISTPLGNGISVLGSYNNIIDSIDIHLQVQYGGGYTYTEDVYVTGEHYRDRKSVV